MANLDDIRETFELIDDWEDRYRYLIDLGRELPAYPEDKRDEDHRVLGCASRVWLAMTHDGSRLDFVGDSDAHLVKGLVAVVMAVYSGKTAKEIAETEIEPILEEFGLHEHLTPQRSNGLKSMVERIKKEAAAMMAG